MEYLFHLGIIFCIYAILAVSLNLVLGYTGLVSMAHAAFYSIGAYTVALASTQWNMNFFVSVFLGMALAALAATIIGIVLSKYKDDYYVLFSLAFTGIVYSILLNWDAVTQGSYGVTGIRRPELFSTPLLENSAFFILSLVFLLCVVFISHWIVSSSFGRVLRAIREDEQAIQVFGYHTFWYKLIIFAISAGLASTAGALFASYITFIDPTTFTIHEAIFFVALVVLGGIASIRGSLLGAAILVLLPEALRFLGLPPDIAAQARHLIYGLVIVFFMLYRPQGFLGTFRL